MAKSYLELQQKLKFDELMAFLGAEFESDLDGALRDYDAAILLKPHANAHFNRGMLRAARGEWARALADFDRALELKAHFADAYAQRGLARLRQGDEAGAARDFTQCLSLNPALKGSLAQLIREARKPVVN